MTSRYAQEMQAVSSNTKSFVPELSIFYSTVLALLDLLMLVWQIDDLLKQRNDIHASYSSAPPIKRSRSKNRGLSKDSKDDGQVKDKKPAFRERPKKKKWYNIHLKVDKSKPC